MTLLPYIGPIVALITSSATLGYARSTLPESESFFEILPPIRHQLPLALKHNYRTITIASKPASITSS